MKPRIKTEILLEVEPYEKTYVLSFLTLDGVMQAPGGPEEDPTGGFTYGGWTVPYFDELLSVSRTSLELDWNNSVLIQGDVVDEMKKLKKQQGPELQVHGSATLSKPFSSMI
jgi:hypothetical protein